MPPHMALRNTQRNLRPHGIGVEATPDNRIKLFRFGDRDTPPRFCRCPELAYIVGLKWAAERTRQLA